jgi:hypothetical protein
MLMRHSLDIYTKLALTCFKPPTVTANRIPNFFKMHDFIIDYFNQNKCDRQNESLLLW